MRISILVFACLLTWISSFAQQTRTINGRITDSKDGIPLSGVTVKVKGQTNIVYQNKMALLQ